MTDQATPAKVRLTDGLGPLPEAALQAVAQKIGNQCAVWEGIGARDVEPCCARLPG